MSSWALTRDRSLSLRQHGWRKEKLPQLLLKGIAESANVNVAVYLAHEMSKRWKISLGIIAGLAVVVLIIWMSPIGRFILTGGLANLREQPFDSQQWKNARTGDQATLRTRMMMLDDLQGKLKSGTDSLTIKEMLGEPERQYGFSYGVGMLTEGMDPMYLILGFDSVGHLSNWDVQGEKSLKGESRGSIEIKVK